jgi:transposase
VDADVQRELDELRRQVALLTSKHQQAEQGREAAQQAREAAEQGREAAEQAREVAEKKVKLLELENKRLAMRLYGRKSEKLSREDLRQLLLALGATAEEAAAPDPDVPIPKESEAEPEDAKGPKKRRKRKRKTTISDDVERDVKPVVSVPEDERRCSHCGEEMSPFGQVEHRRLEYVPGKFVVHVEQREKLACKRKDCQGEAVTADRSEVPDSTLRVGPSVLAELIESKCDDALPVHRQCDRFRRLGVDFPESTAYGYWRHGTSLLIPLAEAQLGLLMEDPNWVGIDDTGLDVLDPTRQKGKYRGHLWCFRASSGLVAYQFTETWEAKEIAGWLALLGGETHVQVDDYKGYSAEVVIEGRKMIVVPPDRRLGCMMHVRRRFYEALKLGDKRAAEPVAWIKKIYKIEEECRGKPPDERLEVRQQHSIPILDAFEKWCDEMEPSLGKTGKLAEAVRYAKQQRVYVRRCFSDGRFEIDNGACEREIREPAIGRKNFLFTGSTDAAHRLAAAYTLVQTCRNLGIATREYLIDVIAKLEAGWPARRLTDLLPQRWAELRTQQT